MAREFENVLYFIQQEDWQDRHAAVFKLEKPLGTWQGYYWDRKTGDWRGEEDVVRRYFNGFDPDVEKVSEEQAMERIWRLT